MTAIISDSAMQESARPTHSPPQLCCPALCFGEMNYRCAADIVVSVGHLPLALRFPPESQNDVTPQWSQ